MSEQFDPRKVYRHKARVFDDEATVVHECDYDALLRMSSQLAQALERLIEEGSRSEYAVRRDARKNAHDALDLFCGRPQDIAETMPPRPGMEGVR